MEDICCIVGPCLCVGGMGKNNQPRLSAKSEGEVK